MFSRPHSITITRSQNTWDVATGQPVQGSTTVLNYKANVQPLNGKELLMLPEADRQTEHLKMFLVEEVKLNDLVAYLGTNYQVVNIVKKWEDFNSPLNHYKATMKKIEDQ